MYDTQRHDIAEWLPRSLHGSILVTTRDRRLGERLADRGKPFLIEPMETSAAEQLFRSRVSVNESEDDRALHELLDLLGHLPLAITQAAAFISENDITSTAYLTAIRDNSNQVQVMFNQDLGDHRRYSESGCSILSTWKLSFNQILEQQPLAAKILSLMAILDLYSVPKYLLITPSTTFADTTTALGTLKAFSLITALDAGKAFEMHRLVQLSVRHWLEMQETIAEYQREALQIVSDHYPTGDYENWKVCEELSPHTHVVLEYEIGGKCQSQQATLLNNIGRFDNCQGRYEIAQQRLAKALQIRKQVLGKHHPDTLQTASYLGEVLFRSSKYKEGEEVMRYALSSSEEVLGISNPLTRINMGLLAEMLTGQGRFDESEPLFRRALEGKEEDLGTNLNDLKNADNLGAVLRRKTQYEEAEVWVRRSMLGREASLGENHPETLRAVNHLGLVLRHMGRFEEAEILNRRALAGFEQTRGREHHFTLQSLDNLSAVLRCQGKFEAAEWQSRRAFSGLKRLMGEDHRHTLQARMSLALSLKEQLKLSEAADLARDVIEGEKRCLGEAHPQVKVSEKALEGILSAAKIEGEWEKVEA